MKKLALLFSVAALTFMGFSCAKKDNNTAVTYQLNAYGQCIQSSNGQIVDNINCNNGYTYNTSGQCVSSTTGQIVDQYYCQMNGNSSGMYSCVQANTYQAVPTQYCLSGNYGYTCIQTATRQPVNNSLCQQTNTGGIIRQQCYGQYLYNGMVYNCGYQTNCSGALMTSVTTNQQVQCL